MRVRILETQGGKILIRIFTILLFAAGLCETAIATNSVQTIAKASSSAASALSLSFPANTTAGNLILVSFDFDSNATLSSVSDSQGNLFTEAGSQLTSPGGARSRVYFAKNIKGGPDTVTVNLSANSAWIEVYVSEYSGVDTVNPIDGQAGASGSSTSVSSGNATTTVANDVIYGYCVGDWACTAGSGFTARSTFNNNLIEDKTATTPGSYAATASATRGWSMQLVALKPAATTTDNVPPSTPSNLSAAAVSQSQINLSWNASTDNVGVTGYQVFRNGAQVSTTTATSFVDSNLAPLTTYSYNVKAFDSAGNVSAQSIAAVATTSSSTDTTPPSVPTNLTGASTVSTQASLSWSASTDNIGVAGYHILRNGTVVGTTSNTSFVDAGLIASTTYVYTITAFDAAGNVSAPSSPLAITTVAAQTGFRLQPSSNGKYLVNSITGQPVFLTGEDGFAADVQLSASDLTTYLNDRAARGYNAIWIAAVDQFDQVGAPKDNAGNLPFTSGGVGSDNWFGTPNAAYWNRLDALVSQASALGITVFLEPSFTGFPSNGYDLNAIQAASSATLTAYGSFIGNRYKNANNIVYVLGGDADPSISGLYSKINIMGTAIAAADPNHMIVLEACRSCSPGNQSTSMAYGGVGNVPSYIETNWIYNTQSTVVAGCQAGYTTSTTNNFPPFLGEDWYENEHGITGFQVRQEGYWGVLSGCYLGRFFGNGEIWPFNAPSSGATSPSWETELSSAGSVGQQYLGTLMRSREHWLMAPDTTHTVLTAGFGSGSTLSVAARSSDGQTIIAYLSNGNASAKTINMSEITSASSTAMAWWYNPQTGTATLIGTFPNSGSQSFTAPDGNDWVLVIDDALANLPTPGSANLSQNPGPLVTTLTCTPNSLMSGASSNCQLALNQNAPSGGASVALTNSNTAAVSVPASVMVSSGISTGTFVAAAAKTNSPQSATVSATLNGSSSSALLSVRAPVLLTSVACTPTTLNSGGTSTCTVTLNQASPSGGTAVGLTNSNTAVLSVPASVTVASGASSATFSAAAAVVTASQSAVVTASTGTSSQSISLTILFADNVPPTVSVSSPTAGQTVSGTITLSASAFDNVGVAWVQFKVDGANVGPQISASPYNYSLVTTSLTNATHTIAVVASDLSGNTATSATISITVSNTSKPIASVQIAAKASPAASSTLSLSFPANTTAGNLILVSFDFDSNATLSSVSDSQGNLFTEVGSQLTSPGGARSRVYFAKNIKGGPDTVTVNLSANSAWIEVYVSEYSGVDTVNPIDGQAGASGSSTSVSSGNATTTAAGDVIYGYCVGDWACTVGSGFAARSTFNNNLIEDKTATTPGSYAATGSATRGWSMQLVALKKAQ